MKTNTVASQRQAAKVAGTLYLALFVLAIVANFVIVGALIDPLDPDATALAISTNEQLFRFGLIGFIVIAIVDVVIAWALHGYFAHHNESLSRLAAWLRLVYSVLLGVGVVFMQLALKPALDGNNEQMAVLLDGFQTSWQLGLIFFGLHVLGLAALMIRSIGTSTWIGFTLTAAGLAYVVDSLLRVLLIDYSAIADLMMPIVAIPAVIAELAFTIWLIRTGWSKTAANN